MDNKNKMSLTFYNMSENEGLARIAVAGFVTRLDPTVEELSDIKTAVSEAVTNCIVHAYEETGPIYVECEIVENEVTILIRDEGIGIDDVKLAMEPLYSSKPEEERSGMGFAFMEIFMDDLKVISEPEQGTVVIMKKRIGKI